MHCAMRAAAMASVLTCAAVQAADSDWAFAGVDADGTVWRYNAVRISKSFDAAQKVWVRAAYRKPQDLIFPNQKLTYDGYVGQWAINCQRQAYSLPFSIYQSGNREVYTSRGSEVDYVPLVPDSMADIIAKRICGAS